MRICIFGAGAVGGHFAVRLALAGHEVSCVMRGPHLEAVKANGLALRVGDVEFSGRHQGIRRSGGAWPAGCRHQHAQGHRCRHARNRPAPLLRDDTAVVLAQNGIPWWYDIGLSKDHPPPPNLSFLDPGGRLRAAIPKARIIGGVIFSSNEVVAPGMVANLSPDRNMLLIGECDDRGSERIEQLRAVLNAASIDSPPVAADPGNDLVQAFDQHVDVGVVPVDRTDRAGGEGRSCLHDVIPRLLDEANSIAQSYIPEVKRVTRTGPAPDHKPSILQDYELGRAMEIDVLVRAPAAFARAAGLYTPMLDFMAALAIQKARDKGLYSG